ncbi:hypothetical protein DEO72_LG10g2095 [Vigna unguiculata]|uniref:Uncharacterized protein n=1 Tax=Vigna unguiculata TaxID=3917 RepID=A0A4D6NAI4_VIGUN|nr:hypothetical protein DEO72_LG10g2095 [Vigna unguiculata]
MPDTYKDNMRESSLKDLCKKNRDIRKRQSIPYTGGAMSLSRRRDNLKIETGRNVGRAEL